MFFVVTYHDTLRHLHMQPNNRLNRRQARYVLDLQPFASTMTLAYRKGSVKSETILCISDHISIILRWRVSIRKVVTTEVPAVA
jgi:hypothetical protein